ncbi:MAG: class I SAM-dependent methyltransferase [Buchananella hordeovulneris]|nr:class I SAM-dependent methyltransferase [Buchananella hordeovulneris]
MSALHPELFTPAGQALLASFPPYTEQGAADFNSKLRKRGLDPAFIASLLTQWRLRSAASAKFGPFAQRMLFTDDGLQQATRLTVAAHHAQRFAAAGLTHVADLGCGLGADSLALAARGLRVTAVERDEGTAACATVNLSPFPTARVLHADATTLNLAALGVNAIFADPARRRAGGGRLTRPDDWSPSLSTVFSWRKHAAALGVKVAPGIDLSLLPPDSHTQWASVDGEMVEAAIWCGPLALEGPGRSALVIRGASAHVFSEAGDPSRPHEQLPAAPLGEFLFEPDGAVIRAGLIPTIAAHLDAAPISPAIAYLTSNSAPACLDDVPAVPAASAASSSGSGADAGAPVNAPAGGELGGDSAQAGHPPAPVGNGGSAAGHRASGPGGAAGRAGTSAEKSAFYRAYRVLEVLPLKAAAISKWARANDVGVLEIKKRGADLDPATLRAAAKLKGDRAATLIATRVEGRHRAIVVEAL